MGVGGNWSDIKGEQRHEYMVRLKLFNGSDLAQMDFSMCGAASANADAYVKLVCLTVPPQESQSPVVRDNANPV